MAVNLDEAKIGITPSTSLISKFRTDLPDVGAAISKAGNNFGDTMFQMGEREYKAEAETAARDAAYAAPITKDENGNFVRTPVPASFGAGTAKMYNELLDTRYSDVILQETQLELNRIQSANLNDPARAEALMRAHVEGVMKTVPAPIAGRLQSPMLREIVQRQGNIILNNAHRDREITIRDASTLRDNYEEQARNAYANGATEEGDRLLAQARERDALIAANHGGSYDPQVREMEDKSILASASLVKQVRDRVGNNTLFESDIDGLIRILSGYDPKGSVMGIDAKWLNDNMPSARQRAALMSQLQQVKSNWASSFNQQKTEAAFSEFMRPYTDGYRGQRGGTTPQVAQSMVEEWGRRNNVNLYTPEGAQKVIQQFGFFPEDLSKNFFSGIAALDPQDIHARYKLYNQLKNSEGIGNSGGPVAVGLGSIHDSDRAFLEHYDMAIGGSTPDVAANVARNAVKNHVPVADNERGNLLLNRFRMQNPQFERADVARQFDSKLSGAKFIDLPADAQKALMYQAENQLAYNIPPERAIAVSVQRFKEQWVKDPATVAGWSRRENALPMSVGPDGKASHEYVTNYVNKIIDPNRDARTAYEAGLPRDPATGLPIGAEQFKGEPNKYTLSGGTSLPSDARFNADGSGNVKMLPQKNGTYQLIYFDKVGQMHPIVDESGMNVQLNFSKVAKMQEAQILSTREENADMRRKATDQFNTDTAARTEAFRKAQEEANATGGPNPDIPPQVRFEEPKYKPVEYAPADLKDVVVPTGRQQGTPPDRLQKGGKASATPSNTAVTAGSDDGTPRLPNIEPKNDYGMPRARVQGQVDLKGMNADIRDFSKTLLEEFPKLVMTSGFRHPEYNRDVGGVRSSQHTHGTASDFSLRGMSMEDKSRFVNRVLGDERVNGIGYYPNSDSIHIDFRQTPAAWGQNRHSNSLPNTPAWFRLPVMEWLNG
jgi:hypothetical protein